MTRLHADGRADIAYDDGDEEEGVDPKWIKDRIEDCHPARAAQAATVGTVVAPTESQAGLASAASVVGQEGMRKVRSHTGGEG